MLIEILQPFCVDTGYDIAQQRNACLNYINRAAKEIYNAVEADAIMREVVLVVPRSMQVSLPPYIGELRGMRETSQNSSTSDNCDSGLGFPVPLYEIGVPRYTSDSWKYKWRNWRLKSKSPIHTSITNASVLTITTPVVEDDPIDVIITGTTTNSQRISETVSIALTTQDTTNSFAAIESIVCLTNRTYDITVLDINDVELATLYNNELKTAYNIVDVASYFWLSAGTDGIQVLMEVLYKQKFYPFTNDTDKFAAEGYEEAILYKALQKWYTGQEGREQDALLCESKAMEVLNNNISNAEVGSERRVIHAANPVYNAYRKMRSWAPWSRGQMNSGDTRGWPV